jgi:hypothetical protein
MYPDLADEAGKYVILKVDSGLGHKNVGMLTKVVLSSVSAKHNTCVSRDRSKLEMAKA